MLLVVYLAGSLRTLRTLLWNGESKLPWKPWELSWMGWLTQTEEDWNRYKQPPPGGFSPRLLGPKANIKHGSQALMHFNVSRLQKEWRREKRNLHRDSGEDDSDCISTVLVSVWPCGDVQQRPSLPCLGIEIYRGVFECILVGTVCIKSASLKLSGLLVFLSNMQRLMIKLAHATY